MAESTTIRVHRDVHAELKVIAEEEGLTLTDTLRKLVEQRAGASRLLDPMNPPLRRSVRLSEQDGALSPDRLLRSVLFSAATARRCFASCT